MVECLPLVEVPLSSGIFSVARLGLFFFASFVAFFFSITRAAVGFVFRG